MHMQLSICCSYLSSAHIFEASYVLVLLQRAFLMECGPADRESPPTTSQNQKADAHVLD